MTNGSLATVGFIGLGRMGGGMARQVVAAGIPLIVYDRDAAKRASLVETGAKETTSAAGVAADAKTILVMVETYEQARSVLFGDDGICRDQRDIPIDLALMSTLGHSQVLSLREEAGAHQVRVWDAPVSGLVSKAESGELAIYFGGTAGDARPFLQSFNAIGSHVIHTGKPGLGAVLKLLNNMLIQVGAVVISEAAVLATKAGLDLELLMRGVSVGTGNSVAFQWRMPRIIARDFSPSSTVDISYKDQDLVLDLAKSLKVPTPLCGMSQQMYQMARAAGFGGNDGTVLVKVYETLAGEAVSP